MRLLDTIVYYNLVHHPKNEPPIQRMTFTTDATLLPAFDPDTTGKATAEHPYIPSDWKNHQSEEFTHSSTLSLQRASWFRETAMLSRTCRSNLRVSNVVHTVSQLDLLSQTS